MMKGHEWRRRGHQKVQWSIVLFILCWCLLFLPGCGDGQKPVVPKEKLVIAYPNGLVPSLYHIAREKGFFEAAGLEIIPLPSVYGRAALQNVIDGKADLAIAADTPFVLAVTSGHKLCILAGVGSTKKYNAIVARRDRGITTPEDLRGKKIGAAFGTTAHFFLDSFLAARGIGLDEVKVVDLKPGQEANDAIEKGTVDAVSYWSYFAWQMVRKLGDNGVIFFDDNLYNDTWALFGKEEYVKTYPGRMQRVLRALLDAQRFIATHPDESRNLAARLTGADISFVDEAWGTMEFKVTLDQSLLVNLEDQTRWAQRNHLIENGTMPNYLNYIYIDGLRSLDPRAVRIIR